MQRNINGMKRKKIEDEVKVRLPQCLIKHYAMRTFGGVEGYLHAFFAFLTLLLYGGERSSTCLICFTLCTNWIEGWGVQEPAGTLLRKEDLFIARN